MFLCGAALSLRPNDCNSGTCTTLVAAPPPSSPSEEDSACFTRRRFTLVLGEGMGLLLVVAFRMNPKSRNPTISKILFFMSQEKSGFFRILKNISDFSCKVLRDDGSCDSRESPHAGTHPRYPCPHPSIHADRGCFHLARVSISLMA